MEEKPSIVGGFFLLIGENEKRIEKGNPGNNSI